MVATFRPQSVIRPVPFPSFVPSHASLSSQIHIHIPYPVQPHFFYFPNPLGLDPTVIIHNDQDAQESTPLCTIAFR